MLEPSKQVFPSNVPFSFSSESIQVQDKPEFRFRTEKVFLLLAENIFLEKSTRHWRTTCPGGWCYKSSSPNTDLISGLTQSNKWPPLAMKSTYFFHSMDLLKQRNGPARFINFYPHELKGSQHKYQLAVWFQASDFTTTIAMDKRREINLLVISDG